MTPPHPRARYDFDGHFWYLPEEPAPPVRIIGVHASDTYLVVEWFARLSEASVWRQLLWFSQS